MYTKLYSVIQAAREATSGAAGSSRYYHGHAQTGFSLSRWIQWRTQSEFFSSVLESKSISV